MHVSGTAEAVDGSWQPMLHLQHGLQQTRGYIIVNMCVATVATETVSVCFVSKREMWMFVYCFHT